MRVDFEVITPAWLTDKISKHQLKQRDVAASLGTDETQLSKWLSGAKNMSKQSKSAAFWYFSFLEK